MGSVWAQCGLSVTNKLRTGPAHPPGQGSVGLGKFTLNLSRFIMGAWKPNADNNVDNKFDNNADNNVDNILPGYIDRNHDNILSLVLPLKPYGLIQAVEKVTQPTNQPTTQPPSRLSTHPPN